MSKILRALITVFIVSLFAASALADELVLNIYPSPGLDWSSPRALAKTVLKSHTGSSKHPIGHVTVEVRCNPTEASPEVHFFSGMTMARNESLGLLLRKQIGMGILFHSFAGEVEDVKDITPVNQFHNRKGGRVYAKFLIHPDACARLARYHAEYVERGYGISYGLPHRPLYGEGAGCSAYGVSFLETAGLFTEAMRAGWSRTIRAPMSLIGGPDGGVGKVPLKGLLKKTEFTQRWAEGNEPFREIFFYDPDLMADWVEKIYSNEVAHPPGLIALVREGMSIGLVFDQRAAQVPSGPIWKFVE